MQVGSMSSHAHFRRAHSISLTPQTSSNNTSHQSHIHHHRNATSIDSRIRNTNKLPHILQHVGVERSQSLPPSSTTIFDDEFSLSSQSHSPYFSPTLTSQLSNSSTSSSSSHEADSPIIFTRSGLVINQSHLKEQSASSSSTDERNYFKRNGTKSAHSQETSQRKYFGTTSKKESRQHTRGSSCHSDSSPAPSYSSFTSASSPAARHVNYTDTNHTSHTRTKSSAAASPYSLSRSILTTPTSSLSPKSASATTIKLSNGKTYRLAAYSHEVHEESKSWALDKTAGPSHHKEILVEHTEQHQKISMGENQICQVEKMHIDHMKQTHLHGIARAYQDQYLSLLVKNHTQIDEHLTSIKPQQTQVFVATSSNQLDCNQFNMNFNQAANLTINRLEEVEERALLSAIKHPSSSHMHHPSSPTRQTNKFQPCMHHTDSTNTPSSPSSP